MTKIFTIGTNGKNPKVFFKILQDNRIDLLIDIRLNNKSQLAGFAKGGEDFLGYFLKEIANISYVHDPLFAPTSEILDTYKTDKNWNNYVMSFNKLIKDRNFKEVFKNKYNKYERICLLCAEETAEKCHRRLVAESVINDKEEIIHL